MSRAAKTAPMRSSPTTHAAIAIVRSVRARRPERGSPSGRTNFCRFPIHLVFTLPTAVADIAYHNKATVYDLLFKASSETLMMIAADPKHLGARVGAISVLHTWGSALTHHPHVHMIAP